VCWTDNPPLTPVGSVGRVVTTGTAATHQFACHNPPTEAEAVAGRPLREDFIAAPPPGTVIERLFEAEDVAPLAAEEVALFDMPEPGAKGLPVEPEATGTQEDDTREGPTA
jgi:hypothetical protein